MFTDFPVTITLHGQEPFELGVKPTTKRGLFSIQTEKEVSSACVKRVREHVSLVLDMIPYTKTESISFKSPMFPTIHVPIQEWEKGLQLIEEALRLNGF